MDDEYKQKAVQRLLQSFSDEMDRIWMREFQQGAWTKDVKYWRQYGDFEYSYLSWKEFRIAQLEERQAQILKERAEGKEDPPKAKKKKADREQPALF